MATNFSVGNKSALQLRLGEVKLIQGPKGDKGDQGDTGPQGAKGDPFTYADFTAAQLAALTGPQGPKGDTGNTGPKGDKGDTGEKGDKGNPFTYADFTAEQLAALTGPQGPKGDKGDKGDTGLQGPKGDKGDTGAQGPKGEDGAGGGGGGMRLKAVPGMISLPNMPYDPSQTAAAWLRLAYGNGTYIAAGRKVARYDKSEAGWTDCTPAEASGDIGDGWNVDFVNGRFYLFRGYDPLVGENQTGTNRVFTSPDGKSWTPCSLAAELEDQVWWNIAYLDGLYIGAMNCGSYIAKSTDGLNWTTEDCPYNVNGDWNAIAAGNGKWVLTGFGCSGYVSSDGENWTEIDFNFSNQSSNSWMLFAEGKFWIFDGGGYVGSSADGESWTWTNSGLDDDTSGLVLGGVWGDLVCVCHNGGKYAFSEDGGASWGPVRSQGVSGWMAAASTENGILITGGDGMVYHSTYGAWSSSWAFDGNESWTLLDERGDDINLGAYRALESNIQGAVSNALSGIGIPGLYVRVFTEQLGVMVRAELRDASGNAMRTSWASWHMWGEDIEDVNDPKAADTNGYWKIGLPSYGVWTIAAEKAGPAGTETKTQTLALDAAKRYDVTISFDS